MKVTIGITSLIELIDIATRFVAKNSTLPILQNIYIKASIDSLIIKATDMEKYIEIESPAKVGIEGAITVNAKMFCDIIKTTDEPEIELSVDPKTQIMTIRTTKDTFEINGIAASEYIALPEVPRDNLFSIDTNVFCHGIEKVEFAVTEKNFTPVLTGILLKTKEGKSHKELVFVGTDSFRLAEYKLENTGIKEDISLIIPKTNIIDIKKVGDFAKEKGCEEIKVQFSENLIAFEFNVDNIKIFTTSLLVQGNFPDYDREDIMPNKFNTTILVDKLLCEKAIRKIGILTRDINNFIQVDTQKDQIIISSGKTEKGAGTTSIPAIVDGEPLSFGINGRYVTDFIKVSKGEEILFQLVDNQKPLILQDKQETGYKYVVRPLIN